MNRFVLAFGSVFRRALTAALCICAAAGAYAQVEPAQVEPPRAEPPPASPAPATESAGFDVLEYRVEGNTVLPALRIEEAVYPFLGEKKGRAAPSPPPEGVKKTRGGPSFP